LTPRTARRINWSAIIAAATLALAMLAYFTGVAREFENKADVKDVQANSESIAALRSQADTNRIDHMRIEKKLDDLTTYLMEN
jgi:hypothetical protein